MARNILKKFTKNNVAKFFKLPGGGNPGTPQSMCLLPDNTVVVVHNQNNANKVAHLRKYKTTGYVSNSDVVNRNLGHGSGCTYCSKNGLIYVCRGGGNVIAMNTNFKQEFTFKLPTGGFGIAYDKSTDLFYVASYDVVRVYPYSAFQRTNRSKTVLRKFKVSNGPQDIGCHNGIVYKITKGSYGAYLDLYDNTNGAYKGTYHVNTECESCAVDSTGQLIFVTAQNRGIWWTGYKPNITRASNATNTTSTSKKASVNAATAFVQTALNEVGTKESPMGSNHVKYSTWFNKKNEPWCSEFVVWCAWKTFGDSYKNIIPHNAAAHGLQENIVNKCGGQWILKGSFAKTAASAGKCRPGDIFTTDKDHNGVANHVGIIEKVSGSTIYTVEGNYSDKVARGKRSISGIFRVARPNWPGGSYGVSDIDGMIVGEAVLEVHPEKLYSSDNYKYLEENKEESENDRLIREQHQRIKDYLQNINVSDSFTYKAIPDIMLPSISGVSNYKKPRTKINSSIQGSSLPATINYVEAPYVKVTLGGVTFGTYNKGKYPNYISGIDIKKTNGSLNQYTINLIHQIAPNDNPNYIDNLISANGFNKIKIEYGDAAAGIAYRDINALLVDVKSKFDFFNNCITYTLYATSSSVMSTVDRRNYPAITDKPSNIIYSMLYETGELLQYFPAMKSRTFTSSNNLIPTNDKKITLNAVSNTTPLGYMNTLVSSMKADSGDYIYYLNINDENDEGPYFKVEQMKTKMNASMFPLIYEVDINYPNEDGLVYNFSVNTDFAWPLAYEYSGDFPTYRYDINNSGNIISETVNSSIKTARTSNNKFISDQNWWTNVTEFPITATLETKGLTSYLLLLNYIKVNVLYFGNKRSTSGVYIVTGQEDVLSGNGFRTKLDLLRVAGDGQYINVDGRVVT